MYLAFNVPHDPRQSPQSFGSLPFEKYHYLKLAPEYPTKMLRKPKPKEMKHWHLSQNPICHQNPHQRILCHHLPSDEQIGQILKALEDRKRQTTPTSFLLVITVCLSGNTDYWESKVCLITALESL